MNSLTNSNFKIFNRFLILVMVFAFSCDDIFVEDISDLTVQLKAPSGGWQGKDTKVSFRWEEVPEAVNYKLEVATPGFSVNHLQVFEKLLVDTKFDTLLTAGEYEWRIKAINSGSSTDYSYASFTILDPFNIASKQVSLNAPEDQYISNVSDVDFRWEALEGASYYSFKIKKSNWMGDSVVVSKLYSTSYRFPLEDGLYAWGVAAIDTVTGKKTDYTIRSIVIDKNPPPVPQLVKPANKDTLHSLTVSLNWTKPETEATYLIEVYSDPELTNKVMEKIIPDTTTYINLEKRGYYYWKVKSIDPQGNSSNYSAASAFYILLPPDMDQKHVVLMSPANESMVINKKVVFWWNLLPGAEKYNIQIVSPTFAQPLKLVYDQLVTTNSVAVELEPGSYEWRVKAKNSNSESPYSSPFAFSIYNTDLTQQKINLLKPLYDERINNTAVKFTWERLNNSANYHLIIKKDSWESGTVVQELNTNNTEIELPFLNGEYYWGLKAVDPQNGSETVYSIRKFVVDYTWDMAAASISLVSPMNNSMLTEKNVTLWWNPVKGAEKYSLQIVRPSFSNSVKLVYDQLVTTNSVAVELEPGDYEWRVKALNSSSESPYSSSYSFSIYHTDLTQQRTILSRPSASELTNKALVNFMWERINSNATYHLLIKKDSWESGTIVKELSTDKTEIEFSFSEGRYFWGIKAIDPQNNSQTQYSTRELIVDMTAPEIPILKAPVNNMVTAEYLLDFTWDALDVADTKLTYTLEMYQVLNNSVLQLASKTTQQKSTVYNLESAGKYKWRVRAKDAAGNLGAFSEYRYFEIRNEKDLSLSTVILLSPGNRNTLVDKKVTFWWSPISGAEKYNIQIVSPSFSNPLKLISDQWVVDNSFTMELEPGNYEWRIKAANNTSETNYTPFSLSMYNNDLTLQKTTLVSPLYGATINRSLLKFSWEKLNSNATYHLLIKKDSWDSGTLIHESSTDKTEIDLSFLDGEYYWGVKAIDPQNNSQTVYSTRKFIIDLTAPEIPKLRTPINNLVSTDYLLDFTWEPSDATDTRLTYTLEMYQVFNGSAIQMMSKTTQLRSVGYNLESVGKYKWRVFATDYAGNQSAYSEFRYFEIK